MSSYIFTMSSYLEGYIPHNDRIAESCVVKSKHSLFSHSTPCWSQKSSLVLLLDPETNELAYYETNDKLTYMPKSGVAW